MPKHFQKKMSPNFSIKRIDSFCSNYFKFGSDHNHLSHSYLCYNKITISSVSCGPGTYFDAVKKSCQFCAKGEYQPNSDSTSCKQCPSRSTTEKIGSYSMDECKCKDF